MAVLHIRSDQAVFSAGADLGELYRRSQTIGADEAVRGIREFLGRIHHALNVIDAAPMTTIAAVHGVTFGGGFELALACDLIIADKTTRFAFPELRLGLVPGFGGIPRLKRDRHTAAMAKRFIKPIPHAELKQEIDLFCDLFSRPAVEAALKKFVESTDAQPYLP